MKFFHSVVAIAAITGAADAQRPTDTSICDYYTTALLQNNTAANQMTLLTLVVNTVVIGNYTMPNVGISVPGILAKGMYNGTAVNLLPYFNGELASSNRGGSAGVSVNFLDGGGAAPLQMNMAADDTSSNQYFLLTHLYQFFGSLLGCSEQGMPGFDAYAGQASMYKVHKFMDLNPYEVGYFIEQVALAAASFGVASSDLVVVGNALNTLFGYRCAPAVTVIPAQGADLQAICIDGSCPLSPNATCAAYETVLVPTNTTSNETVPAPGSLGTATVSGSSATGTATGTRTGTGTTVSQTAVTTAGAALNSLSWVAVIGGVAAFLL